MTQPVNQSKQTQPKTTVSGKFHVGMTAEEAKKKDLYKAFFSRDFTDIDKNKNGVLEDWEIYDERDKECSDQFISGVVSATSGIFINAIAALTAIPSCGVSLLAIPFGTAAAGLGGGNMYLACKENDITNEYRKQHKLDTNM